MESNRDDASRCVALARAAMAAGDIPRARRLLAKSHRMYPAPADGAAPPVAGSADADLAAARAAAEEELVPAGRAAARAAADAEVSARAAANLRRRRAGEAADAAARAAAPPTHTPEQAALVRQLTIAKTHYEVLGVDDAASATEETIRRSYRRLALKVHPDKNTAPGAEAAFQKLTTAHEVLSDPARRRAYDLHGDAAEDGRAQAAAASAASPFGGMAGGMGGDGGLGGGGGGGGLDDTDFFSWLFHEHAAGRGPHPAGGGRAGRRAHARRAAAAAADGEPWSFGSMSLWAVILAVLFWLFVGGSLGGGAPVSLTPTRGMPVQHTTPVGRVPFYTAPDWPPPDKRGATLRKWYRWVDGETLERLLDGCVVELDRRAALIGESHRIFVHGQTRRRAFADKAAAMPMTSCKQYEVLRKKLGARNRSPYRG
ncbi:hypothetical protein MMPV_006613 [Pyropia vietnamensis]